MAVAVTSAGFNVQGNGRRTVFRNSSGTPYVLVDNGAGNIQMWKGNSTTPTSFSEQDAAGAPSDANYSSASGAIDSTDVIHVVWFDDDTGMGSGGGLKYATFNADGTTDTWSSEATATAIREGVTTAYTSIAVDNNDIPHAVYVDEEANMGSSYATTYYTNRIGGSWKSPVQILGFSSLVNTGYVSIALDSDNLPFVGLSHLGTATYVYIGNTTNATSFTSHTLVSASSQSRMSLAVDSDGDHIVATSVFSSPNWQRRLYRHNNGDGWTTWQTPVTIDSSPDSVSSASLVAVGTDMYYFEENASDDDIVYYANTGSGWGSKTTLETGTFNSSIAKWAFWVNNDSSGLGTATFYFDGSDAAASDPDGEWDNETNADDGSTATLATATDFNTESVGFLKIEGTDAPASGGDIVSVQARAYCGAGVNTGPSTSTLNVRIYTDGLSETLGTAQTNTSIVNWTEYLTLSTPSGGWSWPTVQSLEVKVWDANTGTLSGGGKIGKVEVKVFSKVNEIDYVFLDETASPDVQWNTLVLSGGGGGWANSVNTITSPAAVNTVLNASIASVNTVS